MPHFWLWSFLGCTPESTTMDASFIQPTLNQTYMCLNSNWILSMDFGSLTLSSTLYWSWCRVCMYWLYSGPWWFAKWCIDWSVIRVSLMFARMMKMNQTKLKLPLLPKRIATIFWHHLPSRERGTFHTLSFEQASFTYHQHNRALSKSEQIRNYAARR